MKTFNEIKTSICEFLLRKENEHARRLAGSSLCISSLVLMVTFIRCTFYVYSLKCIVAVSLLMIMTFVGLYIITMDIDAISNVADKLCKEIIQILFSLTACVYLCSFINISVDDFVNLEITTIIAIFISICIVTAYCLKLLNMVFTTVLNAFNFLCKKVTKSKVKEVEESSTSVSKIITNVVAIGSATVAMIAAMSKFFNWISNI